MKFANLIATLTLATIGLPSAGTTATPRPPCDTPTAADGSAIACRWRDAWNQHDAAALAALFTPDAVYEDHAFQAHFAGRAGVSAWVGITATAIPDAHIVIEQVFRSGDHIAIRWRFAGTPKSLGAVPGTGRSFDVPAVSLLRLRGELIERDQDTYNLADLERQVGVAAGAYTPSTPH